jgi:hypothetical protein
VQRLVQNIKDLCPKPFDECRILDLAVGEGITAIESAMQGAHVIAVEARSVNLARCQLVKEAWGLDNLQLVQDDVRTITAERYGKFDVILCCGILYHLTADAVWQLVNTMYDMTNYMVFIDTHVSLAPDQTVDHDGDTYHGSVWKEHDEGDSEQDKIRRVYSSLDNVTSFWYSRASLVNMLAKVGFSSILESFNPPALMHHKNRCSFIAIKGSSRELKTVPEEHETAARWGEEHLCYAESADWNIAARLRRLERLERHPYVKVGIGVWTLLRKLTFRS